MQLRAMVGTPMQALNRCGPSQFRLGASRETRKTRFSPLLALLIERNLWQLSQVF